MAFGATNISGERIPLFERAMVPKSSSIREGYVLVHTSDAGDNLTVDVPNAPTALLGGRAFAGISASPGTVDPAIDRDVLAQKLGVAKCALKTSTACTRGGECGYDPADGGLVVPVTPANAANLVVIGRFSQSKSSSAGVQMVGVELHADGSGTSPRLLGALVASSDPVTNTTTETVMGVITIPAGRIQSVGTVLRIRAKARVLGGNASDTLILRARLGGLAGVVLGSTPLAGVDVTNAGGDVGTIDLVATVRAVGASGTITAGGLAGITPGQVILTGGNLQGAGTAGTVSVDTTIARDLVVTAQWSAASSADQVVLEDFTVDISG